VDEAVIKYYRNLINNGFQNSGNIDNSSIFLDNTMGNRMLICGNMSDYMQITINVVHNVIDNIKYKCSCNPTSNVAIEVLCTLVKSKTLDEAAAIPAEEFFKTVGSHGEDLQKKVKGLKELLIIGISKYKADHPY
jgi:NifU-like protein involved in Fe-S cluster formation